MQGKVPHSVFVAAAGAHIPDGVHVALNEGNKQKEPAGHVPGEQYLQSKGLPDTVFQCTSMVLTLLRAVCSAVQRQPFLERSVQDRLVPIYRADASMCGTEHCKSSIRVCNINTKAATAFLTNQLLCSGWWRS